MATLYTSPVGRLVQGDLFEAQTKDAQGNPRVVKTGPNAGQPAPQFFCAVAFSKTDPSWPAFHALIREEAAKSFPTLFPSGPAGPCANPNFSFKVVDGDGIDQQGRPNNTKDGFAGHWVVRFSSSFAPQVFPLGRFAPMDRIHDRNLVRLGHYVRVCGQIAGNENAQRPGVYVNFALVEHAGYGPEILRGPDPATAFATPAVLPPGASAFPLAGAPAAAPAPVNGAVLPPPSAPVPTASPINHAAAVTVPHQPVAPPYSGHMVVPPPAPVAPVPPPAPVAPVPPPAPAVPAGPVMTPKASGVPYAQFIASGWTDDTLRQHGYIQ